MGEVKGFLKYGRKNFKYEPVDDRLKHSQEFVIPMAEEDLRKQGARCMDCCVPFCQSGCPIRNVIPDWNDLVYKGRWQEALEILRSTNNFPEFTGRICPAPCENSCVLAINRPAVTIKNIEVVIINKAYEQGWIQPRPPKRRTGKKVAIVGSGPAGLACADQLNRVGHAVTVYEKNEVVGGLLSLGIPDFKLSKQVVNRRVHLMEEEGVIFKTGVCVGADISGKDLLSQCDAMVLCGGAEQARDLNVPGRELKGIYQAMDFLRQQNRRLRGLPIDENSEIDAYRRRVVVLGGGDTGSDCVGTSNRQGAVSVRQFELLPEPPKERTPDNPWPQWATILRTSSSQEEGVQRDYCINTKRFSGSQNGNVKKLHAVRVKFGPKDPKTGRAPMEEIPGSEFEVETDLVLLAMGFLGPVKDGLLSQLGVELDVRGNVKHAENKMTSIPGVFTAGDMARGQSLVVWAVHEGRATAREVDKFLMGSTVLA